MALTSHLSRSFTAPVRQRGEDYARCAAVEVLQASRDRVEAVVLGSKPYFVTIERHGRTLGVSCTCPYVSSDIDFCKHIWATVLTAERQGLLARWPAKLDVRLILEDFDQEEPEWVEESEEADEYAEPRSARKRTGRGTSSTRGLTGRHSRSSRQDWKSLLLSVQGGPPEPGVLDDGKREVFYVIDREGSISQGKLRLECMQRERRADGDWGKLKRLKLQGRDIEALAEPADRQIMSLLAGVQTLGGWAPDPDSRRVPEACLLSCPTAAALLPILCATGRCRFRITYQDDAPLTLRWDDGSPWELLLRVAPASGKAPAWRLSAELARSEERMPLEAASLLVAGGLVFVDDRVAPLDDGGAFGWISYLGGAKQLDIPAPDIDGFLAEFFSAGRRPRIELPEELRWEETRVSSQPRLLIKRATQRWAHQQERLEAEPSFSYDGVSVPAGSMGRGFPDAASRRIILRDVQSEQLALERLTQLGLRCSITDHERPRFELKPKRLTAVVQELLAAGWHVEAEGKLYRQPGPFRMSVRSGVDWFELDGGVTFGEEAVQLPQLLAALKKGDGVVTLGDGSYGVLPEEWLRRYEPLGGVGRVVEGRLRFTRAQAGFLDALLAGEPEIDCDAVFDRARRELLQFEGITPIAEPPGFVGELRGYQREGLAWFGFLDRFGFGGCLADDMGLGKTVQVLALLQSRYPSRRRGRRKPSLIVVPRSLVFNWKHEAARFTPGLRVLDHTGIDRPSDPEELSGYDLMLTTYGTLRRDAASLSRVLFDYVVLDEAQAIKNAGTQTAKAARLMRADHRLALSGTPIENHLGELWSLFEFLNPGMLGTAAVFRDLTGEARSPDEPSRALLARALRPFMLRRTKEQVAPELPAKLEQTLYCEMEAPQRRLYDELRDHYRRSLGSHIHKHGIARSKIQILEALLRLRQAACHPGLIDKSKTGHPSAKLEMLLPQVEEVLAEGHKALVFSQFTSFLAIVRERLDGRGIPYAYLDGATRDRAAAVARFQEDPACGLFLISIKAGGLGLNLTAAEYVYLLDPWWNPAVEAQAIDRTHRIGQTRRVFAYRLVAADTVEEKILEMQKSKRELADSIIRADESLVRSLGAKDLELLLG